MATGLETECKFVLITSDGAQFEVSLAVIRHLRTLNTMLGDLGYGNVEPIPLANVSARTLTKVLSWVRHNVQEREETPPSPSTSPVPTTNPMQPRPPTVPRVPQRRAEMPALHQPNSWEEEFLKQLSKDDIRELLLAANYLDVKGLMDILCHSVASMIRGKDPDQIRRTFNAHQPSQTPPPENL